LFKPEFLNLFDDLNCDFCELFDWDLIESILLEFVLLKCLFDYVDIVLFLFAINVFYSLLSYLGLYDASIFKTFLFLL